MKTATKRHERTQKGEDEANQSEFIRHRPVWLRLSRFVFFVPFRAFLWPLFPCWTYLTLLTHLIFSAGATTVTGTLRDISVQALDTKITFAPTNLVLVTGTGLSAGPPKTIDTA